AVLARAEQGGEARIRVEARPAQPVDRAVTADQRGALAVADERIVLDAKRHWILYSVKSMTTLMSPFCFLSASAKLASGTRRVIRRASQARSACARMPAAIA